MNGFPLELGIGAGSQDTRVMGLLGRKRSLTLSSAISTNHQPTPPTRQTDGRTYRRTPGDSKDRAYA